DGPAAVVKAEEIVPDLVLLDIGLPGMDGYQVARELRRRPRLREVVLVALTGYGQEEDRARAREAGFDEHLVKPASIDDLQRVLTMTR
ncbi:MAG TPA: response regulator, partial [Thermoanaerobaculia bacterium]|nr:response regulator [Thermoanaerobaculia bacterium]